MARKVGQGKEEEESRARQQEEKTPVRDKEKTPACHKRGHHVVEQGCASNPKRERDRPELVDLDPFKWWKPENTGPDTSEGINSISERVSQLGSKKKVQLVEKQRPNKQNVNNPPSAMHSLICYLKVPPTFEDENLWIASRLVWFDQPRPPDSSQTAPVKIGPSS
ncbi:hypothetical protein STEG23_010098 [Scotinomys teguina]